MLTPKQLSECVKLLKQILLHNIWAQQDLNPK